MEVVLYVVLVCVLVCTSAVTAKVGEYGIHNLDSFHLCGKGKKSGSIFIRPWKAAILTFGNPPEESDLPPPGRDIHECEVSITTQEDFGMAVMIQEMSIEATLNKQTRGWECTGDYIKISTVGTSAISKFLDIFPLDFLRSKKSDELCGKRGKPRFTEVGSNADIFSTLANTIDVEFHQALRKSSPDNNYFKIVITTFKHVKEVEFSEACQGKYQCRGSENYCISPEYKCDSYYNCAVPRGGGDEARCNDPELYPSIFSTTTTIITILASIVGIAFLIGCIITLAKKMRAQRAAQSRSVTPRAGLRTEVSAPPLQRQHTLPPYEAVVMADADPAWKSSTPDTPAAGELPPNYESLFPEGPPKSLSAAATAPSTGTQPTAPSTGTQPTAPSTRTQPTAPSIENSQLDQSPNTTMAPIAVAES